MSTRYLLPCSCGKKIAIEVAQAGQTVRCACGAEIEAPTMREITSLEQVEPEAQTRHSRPSAGWSRRQAWMLFGAVLTIGAVAMTAWLQWSRPRLKDVQTLSPLESWGLWQELRLGANRDPSPGVKAFAKALVANRQWTVVAISLIGLGLFVTVGSFVRRKRGARRSASNLRTPTSDPRPPT